VLAGISWTQISRQVLNEARFSNRVDSHTTANEFNNVGIREVKPQSDHI
jgi:hypothetical protein